MQLLRKHNSTVHMHPGAYSDWDLSVMIHTYFMDYVNGNVSAGAPGITEAFQEYPQWAEDEFSTLGPQMTSFVSKILESGEPIGGVLGHFLYDAPNKQLLENALQSFLQTLSNQKSPMADDIVRNMISALRDPINTLSQLPQAIVNEMKLILQKGDDTQLNQNLLANVLDLVKT